MALAGTVATGSGVDLVFLLIARVFSKASRISNSVDPVSAGECSSDVIVATGIILTNYTRTVVLCSARKCQRMITLNRNSDDFIRESVSWTHYAIQ